MSREEFNQVIPGERKIHAISDRQRRWNINLTIFSNYVLRMIFGSLMILLPIYLSQLNEINPNVHFTYTDIGLINSSYYLGELAFVTIIGQLSDKLGQRKPFLVIGFIIGGLSFILLSVSTSFVVLFYAHALEGVSTAFLTGTALAFIGEMVDDERRGKTMANYQISNYFGMGSGFILGSFTYQILGEAKGNGKYTFIIFGAVLIVFGLLNLSLVEPKRESANVVLMLKSFFQKLFYHKSYFVGGSIIGGIAFLAYVFPYPPGKNQLIKDYVITAGFMSLFLFIMGFISYRLTKQIERKPLPEHIMYQHQNHFEEVKEALSKEQMRSLVITWALVMMVIGTITTYFPIILSAGGSTGSNSENGLSIIQIAVFYLIAVVLLGSSLALFGRLIDVWGTYKVLFTGLVSLMVLTGTMLAYTYYAPTRITSPQTPFEFLLIGIMAVSLFSASSYGPAALTLLSKVSEKDQLGINNGIFIFLMGAGSLTGSVIGGLALDLGSLIQEVLSPISFLVFNMFIMSVLAFLFQVQTFVKLVIERFKGKQAPTTNENRTLIQG